MVQPYRITLLHPHDQGFWWLVVEPPLLVILVGLLFQFLIVPGLLRDLDEAGDAASR
jgi:ABC-type polysaccharide/polyol phosphate export permease